MNTPQYKPIGNLPGYRVGDDGLVWSQRRSVLGEWIQLQGGRDKNGYRKVILCDGHGGRRYARVHMLVLEAFVGPRPLNFVSAHQNGKCDDNRLANLRWTTQADNCADKITCGTAQRGEKHPRAKLTEEAVRSIRSRRAAGESLEVLAREYGVKKVTICAIVTRQIWKYMV